MDNKKKNPRRREGSGQLKKKAWIRHCLRGLDPYHASDTLGVDLDETVKYSPRCTQEAGVEESSSIVLAGLAYVCCLRQDSSRLIHFTFEININNIKSTSYFHFIKISIKLQNDTSANAHYRLCF